MEIRIGIRENQRDLAFETNLSSAQVSALVTNAFAAKQDLVSFEDDKGKTILVSVSSIAFVEIGAEQNRRVGFIA
jgi:prefoldin subunit 5